MNRARVIAVALTLTAGPAMGQAVPLGSQADRVDLAYRRTPTLRVDPFRHVMIPHWGFVFSVGARGVNNSLNLRDIGAVMRIDADDDIAIGDVVDALGLVPRGAGIGFAAQGEGGFYLGGPLPAGLAIGLSAQGRGYGAGTIDDDAVALLRDGNGARQEFTVGDTRGSGLASAEYGLHVLLRLGPLYSLDGPRVTLGAGARLVRPVFYGRAGSLLANGGRVLVTGDSLVATIQVEEVHTPTDDFTASSAFGDRGSGVAGDFLLRVEWPTNGIAFEAMVANLGSVTVQSVARRRLELDIATTVLDTVLDELEDTEFEVVDTTDVDVTLPRLVRFTATAWANAILQVDLSATLPSGGEFPAPLAVDLGTTWRFLRPLPLRLGLVLGDNQGVGFSAGMGIESRSFFFQLAGQSLGGLFANATGVAARFELGAFF